jgi:hypothetical protein
MKSSVEKTLAKLQNADCALVGGAFVVVYRNGRWHSLTLTTFGALLGVRTVHFMSRSRARETTAGWLPGARVLPFTEISEILTEEIERNLLPHAEDYMPLVKRNLLDIGEGPPTDAAELFAYHPSKEQAFLNTIRDMMTTGEPGPYLRFRKTFRSFPDKTTDKA